MGSEAAQTVETQVPPAQKGQGWSTYRHRQSAIVSRRLPCFWELSSGPQCGQGKWQEAKWPAPGSSWGGTSRRGPQGGPVPQDETRPREGEGHREAHRVPGARRGEWGPAGAHVPWAQEALRTHPEQGRGDCNTWQCPGTWEPVAVVSPRDPSSARGPVRGNHTQLQKRGAQHQAAPLPPTCQRNNPDSRPEPSSPDSVSPLPGQGH